MSPNENGNTDTPAWRKWTEAKKEWDEANQEHIEILETFFPVSSGPVVASGAAIGVKEEEEIERVSKRLDIAHERLRDAQLDVQSEQQGPYN